MLAEYKATKLKPKIPKATIWSDLRALVALASSTSRPTTGEKHSLQVSEPVHGFAQSLLRSSSMQSVSLVHWYATFAGKGILSGEQENFCAAHRRYLPAGQNDSMADHLASLPAMSRPLDL